MFTRLQGVGTGGLAGEGSTKECRGPLEGVMSFRVTCCAGQFNFPLHIKPIIRKYEPSEYHRLRKESLLIIKTSREDAI